MKFGHLSTKSSPIGGLVSKDPSFLFSVRNLGKHFQPRKGADRALSNLFKLPRNSVEHFKDEALTHHVHDLLQRQPELDGDGLRFIQDRPFCRAQIFLISSARRRPAGVRSWDVSISTSAWKSSIRRFVSTEKAPTRAFSWLKAGTIGLIANLEYRGNTYRKMSKNADWRGKT